MSSIKHEQDIKALKDRVSELEKSVIGLFRSVQDLTTPPKKEKARKNG